MTSRFPALLTLLVFLLLLTAFIWLSRQVRAPAAFLPSAREQCVPQGLALQGERYPRSTLPTPEGTVLTLPATLSLTACNPGTLTVRATSVGRGEVPPVVSVSLHARPTLSRVVEGMQTLKFDLTEPTHVTVGFLNQTYALELRSVELFQVLLRGAKTCPGPLPGRVAEHSGAWNPSSASGRLFGSSPLILDTCGAAQVRMRVKGNAAGGQWPQLQVAGLAQNPESPITVKGAQTLLFDLAPGKKLSLRLINPLAKETVNSQLRVSVNFEAR